MHMLSFVLLIYKGADVLTENMVEFTTGESTLLIFMPTVWAASFE